MNRGPRCFIASVLALVLHSAAAVPSGYVAAAQAERVPPDILFAVACAESGRPMPDGRTLPWPWALNIRGKARFFSTQTAAQRALAAALARSTNVDIGLGQINWHWHGKRFTDPRQALDPSVNLRTTGRLLREQFDRCACDDWWLAVERYHAPSDTEGADQRRSRYRGNVLRCWKANAAH